ncbi:PadR family transcriptional regulator [Leifsonia shinshuensis]|uniref:PadR family transcriptional regulator n=1 Tax=Leifsonia shinshuensis TaxID=150026 RepID=UPI001F506F73|nr:PadR family transcriptional regulator [Leifsonia shinshuensis]MCI0158381.1 PadR family transcriptional regulator [Leifsonia shinshuensis]
MPISPLRNPVAVIVLGLLSEQSLHPYAMRALMKERGYDRLTRRGETSVYDVTVRLVDHELVAVEDSFHDGRRPQRTVYRITTAGRATLQDWLRATLVDPESRDSFTSGLSFMYSLPRGEVISCLKERCARLAELIARADAGVAGALDQGVPPIFLSEEHYAQALRRAELDWLRAFVASVESGDLDWPEPAAAAPA